VSAFAFRLRKRPRPRLLWLRAFHRIYNPTLAPRALASLVSEFPSIALTMAGPDKGDGSLEETREAARVLRVLDRITFSGSVARADVPGCMDAADVFINTTNVDNTPVSVLEAMASGLCVVSTRVGGIPQLLEHEHDALLVPPDDPDSMARAIERILTEPGLAERLSNNARAKAERFDWTATIPKWSELLVGAAAGAKA